MKNDENKIILVDDWDMQIPYPLSYDGKVITMDFASVFHRRPEELNTEFCKFIILKSSYANNLELIVKYINYFIRFYDQEGELIFIYFKLKSLISHKQNKYGPKAFEKILYQIMFTDTMVEKIKKMVDDNYLLDIDNEKETKSYNDSIKFTDLHTKILTRCSTAIKIMVPIVIHFLYSIPEIKDKNKYLYSYFVGTMKVFTEPGVNIYAKTVLWIDKLTDKNVIQNQSMWAKKEILGDEPCSKSKSLFQKDFMIDLLYKFAFKSREKDDEGNYYGPFIPRNPIKLSIVSLKKQLNYSNRISFKKNLVQISSKRSGEEGELTGLDKLMMNAAKIDESNVVLSDINIRETIEELREQIPYVTDEEIEFYYNNYTINELQETIVNYYYSKIFGGFDDLTLLTRRQYITIMVLLKRRLIAYKYTQIPQLITGNIIGKLNNRIIQNSKFIDKLTSDPLYEDLFSNKFKYIGEMMNKTNVSALWIISAMINTKFTLVDYLKPDKLGEEITINNDKLCNEFISFLNQI